MVELLIPLPHMSSLHSAYLIKHRDNFTFYRYSNDFLLGLRNSMKAISQDIQLSGRESNLGPPKYEGVLITRLRRSGWVT
jgi:hypothetical protein